jgi:outer membrane receptor protein involved in Fe transport
MKRILTQYLAVLGLLTLALPLAASPGDDPKPTADESSTAAAPTDAEQRLREELIYSVDRTPERTFETSRAVKVISGDEIRRMNPSGLAQILEEQAGIVVSRRPSGGRPFIRGLSGKQIMIMIDGVKVNNTSWGPDVTEYLNLVELSQIDRIEIVRGVVSVLGTESLGGVINIITKGSAPLPKAFGGSIGARYNSADTSFITPVEFYGQTDRFRFTAGISQGRFGDLQPGGDAARVAGQFEQRGAFFNGRMLLTSEKSITVGYQDLVQDNIERVGSTGVLARRSLQLGSVNYTDLTARRWADSIRLTAYWNYQEQEAHVTLPGRTPGAPPTESTYFDGDTLGGANLELGTFIGSHHVIYGVDFAKDKVDSWLYGPNATTGVMMLQRGNLMDGARYESLGAYLQDRFSFTKWLTVVAGLRYGSFETAGKEVSTRGPVDLEGKKSDVTGALNLIGHVTPNLNVIVNAFRGFRSPNLQDVSRSGFRQTASGPSSEVPNTDADAEHVNTYEVGVKYANSRFSGSAFLFRNELTNLLQLTKIGFNDTNGNGVQDGAEQNTIQNLNVGEATTEGYELEAQFAIASGLTAWGHYSKTNATDSLTNQPLSSIPGGFGAAGLRYSPAMSHQPWVELVVRHQQTQKRLGVLDRINPLYANGIQGYDLVHLRGGLSFTNRITATLGVENIFDKQYRDIDATAFSPGRQLVVGTTYHF